MATARASARRVSGTLTARLLRATLQMLDGAGRMAPLTDTARVNALMLQSLAGLQRAPVN